MVPCADPLIVLDAQYADFNKIYRFCGSAEPVCKLAIAAV